MPAVAEQLKNNNFVLRDKKTVYQCSNPFRIPRHKVISKADLRKVQDIVRERLSHVTFGEKICTSCRNRAYDLLKKRNQVKPSPRRAESNHVTEKRRLSETIPSTTLRLNTQGRRRTEVSATTSADASAQVNPSRAPVKQTENADNNNEYKPQPIDVPAEVSSTSNSVQVSSLEAPNLTDAAGKLSEDNMSRKSKPQTSQPPNQDEAIKKICCFCGKSDDNEVEFGKIYEHEGIVTHYYCLLLSSNMEQKGQDDEGILGFLADDIQKEIRRGKRLTCSHCRKNGATLGCCVVKCKKIFHFPCGLKNGSLHQFFGEFRSYCINHRPKQKIDEKVKKEVKESKNMLCYICYESVEPFDTNGTLWAPCCKKNAWFHRGCVQQLAMSAGYFFKCPLCNNKRDFQAAMLEYGIYIPRQDASWELVPNAFEELLYRHDHCDAEACACPKGRKYCSNSGKWELILCRMCGSQGMHISCGKLKWNNPVWECKECAAISNKEAGNSLPTNNIESESDEANTQRENSTLNHYVSTKDDSQDDSDSDISVGNESSPLDSNSMIIPTTLNNLRLRPGPRSFKLQQVQKIQSEPVKESSSTTSSSASNTGISSNSSSTENVSSSKPKTASDVICIDSDDEAVEILCESVMRNRIRNNRIRPYNGMNVFSNSTLSSTSSSNVGPSTVMWPTNSHTSVPSPLLAAPSLTLSDDNDDSPFNIIISNVTSVAPEYFASVAEELTEVSASLPDAPVDVNSVKRSYEQACDEDNDCEVVVEKRAKLEIANFVGQVGKSVTLQDGATLTVTQSNVVLPSTKQTCHGDAGTSPAVNDTGRRFANINTDADHSTTVASANDGTSQSKSARDDAYVGCSSQPAVRPVLENDASSYCSGTSGDGTGSKSRSSSCDRSGLIPDSLNLSDIQFKVQGRCLELSYGTCKLQLLKVDGLRSPITSNDTTSAVESDSVSPFAGSNQNISSEKSSKSSFPLRSDDSDEFGKNTKWLRTRTLKNFVYEDDNTLLEYPTSIRDSQNNARVTRRSVAQDKMICDRNDLKENWNPEVSNSSNNDHTNFDKNTEQIVSSDHKANNNSQSESNGMEMKKSDSVNSQRILRRSNRSVRHFSSVQQSNTVPNIQMDSDTVGPDKVNFFTNGLEKSNQTVEKSVRNTRSLRASNRLSITETDEHLNNVNDLQCVGMSKYNDIYSMKKFEKSVFKVSIELKKIAHLLCFEPELFLNKSIEAESMRFLRKRGQLKTESKIEDKVFLIKSQSFDCLLDINKNENDLLHSLGKSKSFDDLVHVDPDSFISTDEKDNAKKKVRKNPRRRTRQFEKYECVR